MAIALLFAMTAGLLPNAPTSLAVDVTEDPVKEIVENPDDSQAVPGDSAEPVTNMSLNIKSINAMAGKSYTLKVNNLPSVTVGTIEVPVPVTYESSNPKVAKVSTEGKISLKSKGKAIISATIVEDGKDPVVLTCSVAVVAKFTKTDFSKYQSSNIINKSKKWAWYWTGEWKKAAKYGATYRKVRIGDSMSYVVSQYGDFKTKKCSKKKDPFLYDKMFNTKKKKLRVSKYADFNLKKGKNVYKLRFYFTKKNKVFGFIYTKNFSSITKFGLRQTAGYHPI
ncbi:MAG: Ig-like domain-containing protein [Eubacterium sp.]|nr:Ig-like domain-containing protein [Eubacterium sp.]